MKPHICYTGLIRGCFVLSDVLAKFIATKGDWWSAQSWRIYSSALRALLHDDLRNPTGHFTADALAQAIERADALYSPSRMGQTQAAYRRFYSWARTVEGIETLPVLAKRAPGRPRQATDTSPFHTDGAGPTREVYEAADLLLEVMSRHVGQTRFLDTYWRDLRAETVEGVTPDAPPQGRFLFPTRVRGQFFHLGATSPEGDALRVLLSYSVGVEGEHPQGPLLPTTPGGVRPLSRSSLRRGLRELKRVRETETAAEAGSVVEIEGVHGPTADVRGLLNNEAVGATDAGPAAP